jgi:hypothetical protein
VIVERRDIGGYMLVDMCDPGRKFESDSEFREVWVAIREQFRQVCDGYI